MARAPPYALAASTPTLLMVQLSAVISYERQSSHSIDATSSRPRCSALPQGAAPVALLTALWNRLSLIEPVVPPPAAQHSAAWSTTLRFSEALSPLRLGGFLLVEDALHVASIAIEKVKYEWMQLVVNLARANLAAEVHPCLAFDALRVVSGWQPSRVT